MLKKIIMTGGIIKMRIKIIILKKIIIIKMKMKIKIIMRIKIIKMKT